jgi:hypothetical protein
MAWLRNQPQERLASVADLALFAYPQPMFITPHEMLDTAEYELIEREREKAAHSILPPPSTAPETAGVEAEQLVLLEQFLGNLNSIQTEADLGDVVVGGAYSQAAYRMSLLAMLNDIDHGILTGSMAELAAAPFKLKVSPETRKIQRDGVEEVSVGILERTQLS